jgi:hypothetical protein
MVPYRAPRKGIKIDRPRAAKPIDTARSVNEILRGAMDKTLLQRMQDAQIVEIWEEVVGPEIFRVARAESFQAGTLTVRVNHPVWRSELALMSKDIIRKLNQALSRVAVRRLRFV